MLRPGCVSVLREADGCVLSRSVVSDSETLWTVSRRPLCPWDAPGKNTGVGCHALLRGISLTQGLNLCLSTCIGKWVLHH